MMDTARETGDRSTAVFDLAPVSDNSLFIMEDVLHDEMVEIFETSTEELNFVLTLTFSTLLMPINFINKLVFAKLTNHNFKVTVSDYLDFLIVSVVIFIWVVVVQFETSDIKYNLFSPEED